ncbi:hypothetical protein OHA70_08115 [Kribbella sp. NBC_00382]|uniref:hypothetical protein n=1 Tax=Kribbella sp. NBC_00382 TaxID=2975967 RepID=UPI002E227B67
MDWLTTSPYLLSKNQLTRTVDSLESLEFQVVRVDAGELGPDLEESVLIVLSKALSFSPLGAGHWGAFSDRLWDVLTGENKQPLAILLEDFDQVLRTDFHAFVRIVHMLLSLTEDLGLKMESPTARQIEYFFVGTWPTRVTS